MAKPDTKTEKKVLSAEEKKAAKKERLANAGPKVVFLPLSTEGASKSIKQNVSHIRGVGSFVTTEFLNAKGETVSGSVNFIPGIKPKSKKGERFLIIDKGPKPKKEKAPAKEEKKKK